MYHVQTMLLSVDVRQQQPLLHSLLGVLLGLLFIIVLYNRKQQHTLV